MRLARISAAAVLGLITMMASAETAQEASIRKLVEARLGGDAKVDAVAKTPYAGLFEVRIGSDILYTDAKADYLFVGRVIDAKTHEDYTKARVDDLTRVKFSDLPLESAVKTVKGNGKRVIAVFEDPNCGYCKRFRHTLQEVDNITVYTFMYNILAEDSAVKSKNVWCSADRAKAWDDWMLNGKAPAAAPAGCSADPNAKIRALGEKLKVTGTPTIIFTDGSRIPGAVDAKTLEGKLASLK
ncbi:DsbC family protein [Noviherbaspirillum massiliense]|uniref:DsbC family protein n=1 Tax=Noviherbaspirillum massiliense TaxID=1465823 RepID=UPI0004751D95|nr:DsbC family protein [Noviherbaspirillum massiliense]